MVPPPFRPPRCSRRVPRASGDGPLSRVGRPSSARCSPRERGWSPQAGVVALPGRVFPARAGMVPSPCGSTLDRASVPRASGDGPRWRSRGRGECRCSPRERGWSSAPGATRQHVVVFPARAGMVRRGSRGRRAEHRVPRASGDGPIIPARSRACCVCSPRERGWSCPSSCRTISWSVFPARAGMVRGRRGRRPRSRGVPRASGDGPDRPHHMKRHRLCSPRERGWSRLARHARDRELVFPARAGMVRGTPIDYDKLAGVPRASGDGPDPVLAHRQTDPCSPRERGWSRGGEDLEGVQGVFPARAGMVPCTGTRVRWAPSVPRASGDGPGSIIPVMVR